MITTFLVGSALLIRRRVSPWRLIIASDTGRSATSQVGAAVATMLSRDQDRRWPHPAQCQSDPFAAAAPGVGWDLLPPCTGDLIAQSLNHYFSTNGLEMLCPHTC